MNLIDRDELFKWIDRADTTPDGGIDVNELENHILEMPVLMNGCEYPIAKEMLRRLAEKLKKELLDAGVELKE